MIASLLAILAALVPLFVWLIRRHLSHEDDPYTQDAQKRESLAKEIIQDDETAANRSLDDDLDRLQVLQSTRSEEDLSSIALAKEEVPPTTSNTHEKH